MAGIPEQFVQPVATEGQKGYAPTSNPLVMRPIFGTVDNLSIEFFMDYAFDEGKTKELAFEYMRAVERVRIRVDRFTQIVGDACDLERMICDMKPEVRARIADLYQKFKNQDSSTETPIIAWVAAKPSEKALLEHVGIGTVEQLADASRELLAHLGPYGKDLQARAKKHVASKEDKLKAGDQAAVIQELRQRLEEFEAEAKRKEDKLEKLFAAQEAKAKSEKKKGGRPKKVKEIKEDETISSPVPA